MAQFFTPWVVALLVAAGVFLALTFVPNLAYNVGNGFVRMRKLLIKAASSIGNNIRKVWSLDGEKQRQEQRLKRLITLEQEKQEKQSGARLAADEKKDLEERITNKRGGPPRDPTSNETTSAWVRRIIYLMLVLVCVGSDYVLVSTRAPILFGGGEVPPFLKALFQYLQVITGVLFVSVAALSGMLIQENATGLSDTVKIEPDIGAVQQKIKLGMAIFMFVLDVIVVVFLTIGGILQQYLQTQDLEVVITVFIGTSTLVAIAIFLAWPGWYQALEGLGTLVIGGAVALLCLLLSGICALIAGLMGLFNLINTAIYGLTHREEQPKVPEPVDRRDLTIIGFGSQGSAFAEGVCKQVRALQGDYAWLAGYYMPDATLANRMTGQLRNLHVAADVLSPDTESDQPDIAAAALVKTLDEGYFSGKPNSVKRLIWVAHGPDLEPSMDALKTLDNATSGPLVTAQAGNAQMGAAQAQGAQTAATPPFGGQGAGAPPAIAQNVQLVIVWIVPDSITPDLQRTATMLNQWAQTPGSILATTLVIQENCPLANELGARYYDVLYRSIAALLVAGNSNSSANFAAVAQQLHDARYSFSALEAGAIGVNASKTSFQDGLIIGSKGDINPTVASNTLKQIAGWVFPPQSQRLSTVRDTLDAVPFINLVVPVPLRQAREFQAFVCQWLRNYGVNQNRVTVERLNSATDKGINISGASRQLRIWKGDYYFHFTALRGIGQGNYAKPKDLA